MINLISKSTKFLGEYLNTLITNDVVTNLDINIVDENCIRRG